MRLIDADALGVGRCSGDILPADYCTGWNRVIDIIGYAPTVDAVEVIRCKDCKYYDECTNFLFDDDYCSRGERK